MHRSLVTLLAVAVTASATLVACSSDVEPQPAAETAAAKLQGAFRPKAGSGGGGKAIDEIRFQDSDYRLLANGCKSDACAELGEFVLDQAKNVLTLTPRGGQPYTLRFEVGAVQKPAANGGLVAPKNLVDGPQQLLVETGVQLIESATIEGREYTVYDRDSDVCDESGAWPRVWESMCSGRGYYGIGHCYVKSSECGSSARSCLDDAKGGKRWDQRASQCSELGGTGFESTGSGIYVAQVCCKR